MSAKAPQKEVGIQFPKAADGTRSTSEAGKSVFAASMAAVDEKAAQAILAEKKWRFKYAKHVVQHVEKGATDGSDALKMAQAGLAYVHDKFVFIRGDREISVKEAMKITDKKFETGFIKGLGKKPTTFELEVPYGDKVLKGDELLVQVEKWVRNGTIEMSAGHAITQVVRRREWLDLSDKYFVLLGALSAMGPLRVLLALGANIVAVDINIPRVWNTLLDLAEKSCGTMTFPLSKSQKDLKREEYAAHAGCDLMADTPEVKNWLLGVHPDKALTVGSYAYLDADRFVKLSVAMDAIVDELCIKRKDTSIAYLCTPTDCHVIPAPAYEAQVAAFKRESLWMSVLRLLSRGAWLAKNARRPVDAKDGSKVHIVDAIVLNQGPNYILAKRIQHWRAVVARQVHKCVVSTNIAPSTATASVVSNRSFAWAYNGMHNFKPMEVFKQETSNAVMTALLLHDLSSPDSVANPRVQLKNPLYLFADNSFHGGPWRTAHRFTSIGAPSALLYFVSLFIRFYLAAYNLLQTIGWGVCLVSTARFLSAPENNGTVWDHTGKYVTLFQFLALLEIAHAVLGLVSSAVLQTTIQVFSRLLLVGIASTNPIVHSTPGLSLMLMCWCITEVIRYGYFFAKLAGVEITPLTWLRYSLFIILYPAGVAGEVLTATSALPTMHATLATINTATAEPNTVLYAHLHRAVETHLVSDVSDWIRYVIFPAYFLGLPFLYMHMLAQRKKVLRPAATATSKKQKKD